MSSQQFGAQERTAESLRAGAPTSQAGESATGGSATGGSATGGSTNGESTTGGSASGERVRVLEQRGLWFEEFEPDVVYQHRPGRTFGEADNSLFSALTMNPQALHVDAVWSAQQPFGQRLVNSMLTLATLVGLSVEQLTQGTIVANLGFREVLFPAPMYHGDTLLAQSRLLSKRLSKSRPGEGVVTLEHTGRNQHGDVVVLAVRAVMIRCRPVGQTAGGQAPAGAAPPEHTSIGQPAPEPARAAAPPPSSPAAAPRPPSPAPQTPPEPAAAAQT